MLPPHIQFFKKVPEKQKINFFCLNVQNYGSNNYDDTWTFLPIATIQHGTFNIILRAKCDTTILFI